MEKRTNDYGPQSTDNVAEGTNNLYFTAARVADKASLINGVIPLTQLPPSFTPSAIKGIVTGGTFTNGELQGIQPIGSVGGMRFCDANYKYEFTNGKEDVDGSLFVWVRLVKV